MSGSASHQKKAWLEDKMRSWPKQGEPIKVVLREMADLDGCSWLVTNEFGLLVKGVEQVAFRGTTRSAGPTLDLEMVEDMCEMLKTAMCETGATIKLVLKAFLEDYEVDGLPKDTDDLIKKEGGQRNSDEQEQHQGRLADPSLAQEAAAAASTLFAGPIALSVAWLEISKLLGHFAGSEHLAADLVTLDSRLQHRGGAGLVVFTACDSTLLGRPPGQGLRYVAIVLNGGGLVQVLQIGLVSEVDALINSFVSRVTALLKKEARLDGSVLRKLVFDPVFAAAGEPAELYVVPVGNLGKLSLAMLPLEEDRRDVLDLPTTLSYLCKGSELLHVHDDRSPAVPGAGLITESVGGGPVVEEEVRSVGRALSVALRCPAKVATVGSLEENAGSELLRAPVVHCASNMAAETAARLPLTGTQLFVHTRQVADPVGFAEAVTAAGAATQAMNLLESSGSAFAELFYRSLMDKKESLPAAVKAAQLELRSSGASTKDWGGYVVYGNCQQLELDHEALHAGRPAPPRPFLVNPVFRKRLTDKVASKDGLECLVSESCTTAFLRHQAHKQPNLGIYVPTQLAAGPVRPQDAEGGLCVILGGLRVILEGQVNPDKRLAEKEVVPFLRALLSTLDAAYSFGLLHGDLRPEQILWREDGCPLLAGFGAATCLDEWSPDDPYQLAAGVEVPLKEWAAAGEFTAPEVLRASWDQPHATVRSDVWSLAKLVLHFSKEVHPNVRRVLDGWLAEKPEHRPESFAVARQQLEKDFPQLGSLPFTQPLQAPADQHAIVTGLYRLTYDRVRTTSLQGQAALEAVAPTRQIAHLLARAHSVVGSQQAETCARQALELAQRFSGRTDPPEASDSLYHLGLAHLRRGRLPDAEEALWESLRLGGALPDAAAAAVRPSSRMAAAWQALSSVLLRRGKLLDTNTSANAALRTWEAVYPGPHPGTAASLYHLAILLLERGETHSAEDMARRSLDMAISVYGPNHRAPAASWHLLGSIWLKDGKPVEAEHAATQSLQIRERLHGGTPHPDVAASLLLLGSVRDRAGKLDLAEEAFLKALDMMQRLKGTDADLEVSSAYRRLGSLRLIQGKPEQAEVDMCEALKISREVHGSNPHPDTIAALHTLGVLHFMQQKYNDAREAIKEAQALQQQLHGPAAATHPRTRDLDNLLKEVEAVASGEKAAPQLLQNMEEELAADSDTDTEQQPHTEAVSSKAAQEVEKATLVALKSVRVGDQPKVPLGSPAFLSSFPEMRTLWQLVVAAQCDLTETMLWTEPVKMAWFRMHSKAPEVVQFGLETAVALSSPEHKEASMEENAMMQRFGQRLQSLQPELQRRLAEAITRKHELATTDPVPEALLVLPNLDPGMLISQLHWHARACFDAEAHIRAERAARAAVDLYEDLPSNQVDREAEAALHCLLGEVLAQQGRLAEAEKELTRAASLQDTPSGAISRLLEEVRLKGKHGHQSEAFDGQPPEKNWQLRADTDSEGISPCELRKQLDMTMDHIRRQQQELMTLCASRGDVGGMRKIQSFLSGLAKQSAEIAASVA